MIFKRPFSPLFSLIDCAAFTTKVETTASTSGDPAAKLENCFLASF